MINLLLTTLFRFSKTNKPTHSLFFFVKMSSENVTNVSDESKGPDTSNLSRPELVETLQRVTLQLQEMKTKEEEETKTELKPVVDNFLEALEKHPRHVCEMLHTRGFVLNKIAAPDFEMKNVRYNQHTGFFTFFSCHRRWSYSPSKEMFCVWAFNKWTHAFFCNTNTLVYKRDPCRFGKSCNRRECLYKHYGRNIEEPPFMRWREELLLMIPE